MSKFIKSDSLKIDHIVNAVIIRMIMITTYIMAFRTIAVIKQASALIKANPMLLVQVYKIVESKHILRDNNLRSFCIILMGISILLPIFKTLTLEIATDTIWFNFFTCQIIYCIGSVRSTVLQEGRPSINYSRDCVIPLDESLLISKKISASREAPSIASVIGFILIFSRIRNNLDIIYLQTIGFILYFFIPNFLERKKVHLSAIKTALLACAIAVIAFLFDRTVCIFFVTITTIVYAGLNMIVHLLD